MSNWKERKYRREMLRAIREAAGDSTMTNGLRVIRRFEEINNVQFDPFNRQHRSIIVNCGVHEEFFRAIRKAFGE